MTKTELPNCCSTGYEHVTYMGRVKIEIEIAKDRVKPSSFDFGVANFNYVQFFSNFIYPTFPPHPSRTRVMKYT